LSVFLNIRSLSSRQGTSTDIGKMKKYSHNLIFLLFFCLVHLVFSSETSESMAVAAITEIARRTLSQRSIDFDFVIYRCELDYLVDEIVKSVDKPVNINEVRTSKRMIRVNQSAIVLVDHKELKQLHNRTLLTNKSPQNFHFYIYLSNFNGELEQISLKELVDPRRLHRFSYYLLDRKDSIELVTYTTFQQPNCREINQVTINRFSKESSKWKSDKFAIEKFRNFNGCELVVYRSFPENNFTFPIFKLIRYSLNFKPKFVVFDRSSQKYLTEEVPTDFKFKFESTRIELKKNENLKKKRAITHYIFDGYHLLIVTRFPPYSMLDKALLPFDSEVWWWLIGFLTAGVVSIIAVSFMRKRVKNLVFGSQVKAPLLNMA
jgi:hypothetical protein